MSEKKPIQVTGRVYSWCKGQVQAGNYSHLCEALDSIIDYSRMEVEHHQPEPETDPEPEAEPERENSGLDVVEMIENHAERSDSRTDNQPAGERNGDEPEPTEPTDGGSQRSTSGTFLGDF